MLGVAKTSINTLRHLPDERDWEGLNHKWLADIIFTVDRVKFEKMIKDAVKARKERLQKKHKLNVEMRPEFAQALQNFMSSSSKSFFIERQPFSGERSSFTADEDKLKKKEDQGRARRGQAGGRGYAQ